MNWDEEYKQELERKLDAAKIAGATMLERIKELEAALDVALEALEKSMYPQKAQLEAIAKLKEVRK